MSDLVACDKCAGTGRIANPSLRCDTTLHVGSETVECYASQPHPDEPHMAILCAPCSACGGYDEHDDTCAIYTMKPENDGASHWYAWWDGDTALRHVNDSVGRQWRLRFWPTEPVTS